MRNARFLEKARKADFALPSFVEPVTDSKDKRLAQAYNYYNFNFPMGKAISFVIRYMENGYSKAEIDFIKNLDPWVIGPVSCWIAALLNSGVELPNFQRLWLRRRLVAALNLRTGFERPKVVGRPTVQETAARAAREWIAYFEVEVDRSFLAKRAIKFDTLKFLVEHKVPAYLLPHIIKYYTNWYNEMAEAHKGEDKDLVQAYSLHGRERLMRQAKFLKSIIDGCIVYGAQQRQLNPKKTRKKTR